jgi:DHA3 family tetracycline resistance protein-like MFS transporter
MGAEGTTRGWRRIGVLRPLEIRDFRLLWSGLTISLIGDGIFFVALPWQVLELSNSPTAIALVGLVWTVPMVTLLLLGGVIADRFDRRRVMLAADGIRLIANATLGVLSVTGTVELWHVFVLAALYGAGEALFFPAFSALVPEIVPRALLVQANSLDSFVRPLGAQLLGPALGGVVIDAVSVGGALLLDAGSFLCSMAALLLMSPRPRTRAELSANRVAAEIREGFRFVRSRTWLWGTLVCTSVALLVYLGPWEALMPFLVKNELEESARSLGLVYAAGGLGSIMAALFMGQRGLPSRMITVMFVVFSVSFSALILYGLAVSVWQLIVVAVAAAALNAVGMVIWTTLLQRNVPGDLLGRVTSLDWLVSISLVPISFSVTGPNASAIGVRTTLVAAGVLGASVWLAFLFLPGMRDLERRPATVEET